ncbi:MAG: HAMP domain-containing histidine kinase, partial [Lachnospiraceae bacterium]|nr:HAMP domain-containing histidine kinase [Lachnospiraceae bacterium]
KMLNRINRLETSRQEFVSNVSHELKTPLTSMKVLCDSLLMQEDVPAEMYREFMGDLSNEIDRENAIISDLLTLVKLDDDSAQPLNITSVNINNLVESTMKLVRPLAEKKNIEMIMETFRPIVAEVDEVRLSMALLNLIENAVKYNNVEGWVHVSLNADQTYFYITIEDNGFGIPKAAQEHIFDRFYRVDKARDRATGGTGLGLAITKRIVLSHNGIITVEGDEGIGTKFVVKIPLTHIKKA